MLSGALVSLAYGISQTHIVDKPYKCLSELEVNFKLHIERM